MKKIKIVKTLLIVSTIFFVTPVYGFDINALRDGNWWKNWWDNDLERLNGYRISAKVGGWNFWYKNDKDYVYSDLIGSIFSGEEGRLTSYPMFGAGIRFPLPIWKNIFLVNGVVSTSRISLEGGVGVPIGDDSFNVTPWTTLGISFTNGTFIPVFALDWGIDFLFDNFIIGVEFSHSTNDSSGTTGWESINYGLSFGFIIWGME